MASYLRLTYCTDEIDESEEIDDARRVEDIYIDWVTVAFIFFAAAVYVKGFEKNTGYVSIIFFVIVVLMLIIISFDYIIDRCKLIQRGQEIRQRVDWLFGLVCLVIITITIFTIDAVRQNEAFNRFLLV